MTHSTDKHYGDVCGNCGNAIHIGKFGMYCPICEPGRAYINQGGPIATDKPEQPDLIDVICSFKLSYTRDGDGDAFSILDRLTPDEDNDISRGKDEVAFLAEHIGEMFIVPLQSRIKELEEQNSSLVHSIRTADRLAYDIAWDAEKSEKQIHEERIKELEQELLLKKMKRQDIATQIASCWMMIGKRHY